MTEHLTCCKHTSSTPSPESRLNLPDCDLSTLRGTANRTRWEEWATPPQWETTLFYPHIQYISIFLFHFNNLVEMPRAPPLCEDSSAAQEDLRSDLRIWFKQHTPNAPQTAESSIWKTNSFLHSMRVPLTKNTIFFFLIYQRPSPSEDFERQTHPPKHQIHSSSYFCYHLTSLINTTCFSIPFDIPNSHEKGFFKGILKSLFSFVLCLLSFFICNSESRYRSFCTTSDCKYFSYHPMFMPYIIPCAVILKWWRINENMILSLKLIILVTI
jgi:hypothetical protein